MSLVAPIILEARRIKKLTLTRRRARSWTPYALKRPLLPLSGMQREGVIALLGVEARFRPEADTSRNRERREETVPA